MKKIPFHYLFCLLLVFVFTQEVFGQNVADIRKACHNFLSTLEADKIEQVSHSFDDTLRQKWNNLPIGLAPRTGLRYGELTDTSRIAFHRLLTIVLSSQGYLKVTSIMQLDDILNEIVQEVFTKGLIDENTVKRLDSLQWAYENYYISLWGEPHKEEPWGFSFSGHHLGINLTVLGEEISLTPLFLGTDPAEVQMTKYAGWRVLSKEEDFGFLLLNSLTEEQKSQAILSREIPKNIITNPSGPKRIDDYFGISAKHFNKHQKTLLELLIQEYVHNYEHEVAHQLYDKVISSGIDNIYFAWIGGLNKHESHYYIINSPDILIEYDNYPRQGNHIHLILREKDNDFGEDLLKKHYLQSDHHKID